MACGTPVIAFAAGGPLETIVEGKTGEFFRDPTAESLQEILEIYDQKKYSSEECLRRAAEFSTRVFKKNIQREIDKVLFENEGTK